MKKFTAITVNCSDDENEGWVSMGFEVVASGVLFPDAVFFHLPTPGSIQWESIKKVMPKVLVISSRQGICFPDYISSIYQGQEIVGDGLIFTTGARIQGQVDVPGWGEYADGKGLTMAGQIRAIAGAVYRFLLDDAIRENEEWCGHMSSVVGPA